MDILYEVYAKLDSNNCIVGIEGTAFHSKEWLEENGYVKIDEGSNGEIYGHCQPLYLKEKYGKPTYDEQSRPNFRIVSDEIVELTDDEKSKLFPKNTQEPTQEERLQALESAMLEMVLVRRY